MSTGLMGITIDCVDPARLASFWSALLDIPVTHEHGDDGGWATVGSHRGTRPRLTFQRVPEPRVGKNRVHLDVRVGDIEVGRQCVESLGGRWSGTRTDHQEGVVLVMHDPEGNEFCIIEFFDAPRTP